MIDGTDAMRIAVTEAVREAFAEQIAAVPEPLRTTMIETFMASKAAADQIEAFVARFTQRLN